MALQDTLQQQYNRTLQGTIGQSQRSRQQAQRASQGQSGTTDPSMDWAARQASGFRGAGFQPVSLSNVPQSQIQATKDTFGPSTAGGYVEGGKNVEGFYGDTNPYTEQGSESLFNKAGFTNLGKADSMDLTYASLIPELQNNLMKYDGVGSLGNLYGRNGADPRKIQVNEQTLANNLTNKFNSLVNYTPSTVWKDFTGDLSAYFTGPQYKEGFDGLEQVAGGYDQAKMAADGIRQKAYNSQDANNWNSENGAYNPGYEQSQNAWNFGGKDYMSEGEAQAAKASQLSQILGSSKAQQSEYLSQLLTQGGITGRSLGERGSFGGNQVNDVISGDLMKLFGSKDISYGGKNYGTVLDMAGYDKPLQNNWNETTVQDNKNIWRNKQTITQDQGSSDLFRSLNDPTWWSQNAKNLGGGQIMLTPEQLASSPGFTSSDSYDRNLQEVTNRITNPKVSKAMSTIGAIVDYFVPYTMGTAKYVGANTAELMAGQDFGDVATNSIRHQLPRWIAGEAIAPAISAVGSLAGNAVSDVSGGAINAGTAGNAISGAANAGINSAMYGGSLKDSLFAAAAGGIGSGVGQAVSNGLGNYFNNGSTNGYTQTAGNVAGGVTSQGLQNLLSNNKLGKNMGMAAVQGGMSSLGNLFAPKGSTPQQVQQMNSAGKNAGSLIKTISKMNKSKVK